MFQAQGRPSIPLDLQTGKVYAGLRTNLIDTVNGSTSVTFEYTVTNEDTSGENAVGVGSEITDYPDTTSGALLDQNGNSVVTDLSSASPSQLHWAVALLRVVTRRLRLMGTLMEQSSMLIITRQALTPRPCRATDPTGGFVIYSAAGPSLWRVGLIFQQTRILMFDIRRRRTQQL